jgi:hypothetical protein
VATLPGIVKAPSLGTMRAAINCTVAKRWRGWNRWCGSEDETGGWSMLQHPLNIAVLLEAAHSTQLLRRHGRRDDDALSQS